jgi:hypothetical protein
MFLFEWLAKRFADQRKNLLEGAILESRTEEAIITSGLTAKKTPAINADRIRWPHK